MASRKLEVQILGDASSLQRAFGQAGKSASSFGSRMKSAGKMAAIGLGVGVVVAAAAITKFAKAALDAEKSQVRLESAFKNAGASAKEQADALKAVSDVSNKAGLDDEALADSLARLTQVTGDVTKAQKQMALAADVARGRGVSLEAATQLVTRASLGNVGAMKRLGIAILPVTTAVDALKASNVKATAEQMAAAKAADLTSTKQAALAGLQEKFGGAAEAYGKSASGSMDRFKVAIENVEEGLGRALLPTLGKVAGGLATFINKFNEAQGASEKFKIVLDSAKKLGTDTWNALKAGFAAIQWGQIWDTVKTKIANVDWHGAAREVGDRLIKALNGLSAAMARVDWNKVGQALGEGIKRAAAALGSVDWGRLIVAYMRLQIRIIEAIRQVLLSLVGSLASSLMNLVRSGAAAAVDAAFNAGKAVGMGIMRGIGAGIDALMGWALGKMGGIVQALKAKLMFWASPPEAFGFKVGARLIQGVAAGMDASKVNAETKIGQIVSAVIERAKTVMESKRASFGAAWDTFAGAAGSAFDAVYAKIQTKSEKALAKLQAGAAAAARADAISSARVGLATAQAGDDPAAVVTAQKALDDALRAQQEFALQQRAAKERLEMDARIAAKKERFLTELTALQTHLAKVGAKHEESNKAILALFKRNEIGFDKAGAALGQAFADGLHSKVGAVSRAALAIAAAASRPVILKSPAEIGPLSKLDHFWDAFVPTLMSGLDYRGMTSALSGAMTLPSAANVGAGGAGGNVYVTVQGWVGNDQEIAARIQKELIRIGRSNTSILSGPGVNV